MKPQFYRLNEDWNADPNAPNPVVEIQGQDIVLRFLVNSLQYPEFQHGELGILRFVRCERYRLGATNDEGWYAGQCRFSKLAPAWGEFYLVQGDEALLEAPQDWKPVNSASGGKMHFLFYFRDDTFECVAEKCIFEASEHNALLRVGKLLTQFPEGLGSS